MSNEFQWARYQAHYYLCWERNATHALISYPGYSNPGWVNVAPNGRPLLLPAVIWAPLSEVEIFADDLQVQPLPPVPVLDGYQIGARCEWGTSLAEWAIVRLSGDKAIIRQVRGWARAIEHEAPLSEVKLLGQSAIAVPVCELVGTS